MGKIAALQSMVFRCMTALVLSLSSPAFAGPTLVTYPAYESTSDTRFNEYIEVLDSALKATTPSHGAYVLQASKVGMSEARYMSDIKRTDRSINVVWSSTSVQKEKDYLPLRIPLRKGLLGYRIALIAQDSQARIDKVKTLDDLKKLQLGQGTGWGDVQLYESNGLSVQTGQYENLFKMTAGGRFDLFPRGISEVFVEHETHHANNPQLAIEQNLLIYYPWPYYFFFNLQDLALRDRVEAGIRIMMKDGSFDALFKKHNGVWIDRANLKHRRVIRLANPMLPKETPLADKALWYDPTK